MLVITPLIALARQQVQVFSSELVKADSKKEIEVLFNGIPDFNKQTSKIWIVSPEKLQYSPDLYRRFAPDFFVVDEAHTYFEWSESFRPAFQKLIEYAHYSSVSRSLWLTATLYQSDLNELISRLPQSRTHSMGHTRLPENLDWIVEKIHPRDRISKLMQLIQSHPNQLGVVFVNTRDYAVRVARLLADSGISVLSYHAGYSDEERRLIENQIKNEQVQVVVSTSAFGMGMDLKIHWVCMLQAPMSILQAVQMGGRAGRFEARGKSYLFWDHTDFEGLEWLIQKGKRSHQQLITLFNYLSSPNPDRNGIELFFSTS
jgi:ATP-dependent DNA helicase RecQ